MFPLTLWDVSLESPNATSMAGFENPDMVGPEQ